MRLLFKIIFFDEAVKKLDKCFSDIFKNIFSLTLD